MRLKDKVILITGSTTGIGEGIARICVQEGARVIIHGTREAAGAKLVEELRATGGEAFFVAASLSDPDAAPRLIEAAVAHGGGRLDGLVNNAAVMTRSDLETTTSQVFDDTMAVNLRAPLLLIQAALAALPAPGRGPGAQHRFDQRPLRRAQPARLFAEQGRDDHPHTQPRRRLRRGGACASTRSTSVGRSRPTNMN